MLRGFATLVLAFLLFIGQESWFWTPGLTYLFVAGTGFWGLLWVLLGANRFINGGETARELSHQAKHPDWRGRP